MQPQVMACTHECEATSGATVQETHTLAIHTLISVATFIPGAGAGAAVTAVAFEATTGVALDGAAPKDTETSTCMAGVDADNAGDEAGMAATESAALEPDADADAVGEAAAAIGLDVEADAVVKLLFLTVVVSSTKAKRSGGVR